MKEFGFDEAIRLLKAGEKVSRSGWNGKGMFIWMAGGSVNPAEKMLGSWFAPYTTTVPSGERVVVNPFLCMKASDGSIVVGWLASQTDMLAEDWGVIQ